MSETVKAKLIEINKTELKVGAKYIFLLHPAQITWLGNVREELDRLIGEDNYTLLPFQESDLKVYEIAKESDEL